ncbi:MAG TPA: DUF5627 domain-containing protein [Bacteroidales bacterium]|nr:DUF5627 domain-containing protein [Bacteroidales bacterium]
MKKILYLLSIVILLYSCENQDIEFPDFAYQTVYFPFQTPLRSIMLGNEVIGDNSIDLEHAFSVGVSIGGMYENIKDKEVSIELAPELATNIQDGSGNDLQLLPAQYYTAVFDKITIPAGSFFGKLRVNLTDAFFADALSIDLHYILPLRITAAAGDSILSGEPVEGVVSPDPRNPNDWITPPLNYVLFGVKYINATHGVYLLRGKRTNTTDAQDVVTYSSRFVTGNDMTKLTTKSMTENYLSTVGGTNKESANAKYSMLLTFNNSTKSVIISQKSAATVVVNGTGTFYDKADPQAEGYNGEKHRTIYLDYTYVDAGKTYHTNDSLVFVDTDMKFETFSIQVVNP